MSEHVHQWTRRQNVTTSGYAMPPYETCDCGDARPLPDYTPRMTADHPTREERHAAVHQELGLCPFREDVNDASMCMCGLPALNHDEIVRAIFRRDFPTIAALVADPQPLDNRAYLAGYEFALRNLHDEPVQADLRRVVAADPAPAQPDAALSDDEIAVVLREAETLCRERHSDRWTTVTEQRTTCLSCKEATVLAARAAQPVLAPEVSRGVAEVKAEALREAADVAERSIVHVSDEQVDSGGFETGMEVGSEITAAALVRQLRDRADRLVRDALPAEGES